MRMTPSGTRSANSKLIRVLLDDVSRRNFHWRRLVLPTVLSLVRCVGLCLETVR